MTYELWDMRSRNLAAWFDSEEAALEVVRDAVRTHGEEYGLGLALVCQPDDGAGVTVAEAGALIDRARVSA